MATRTKHYEAELKDLDQLLQVIESEMGPDAQLETMEYTKGGLMGLGGRRMISITATVEVNPHRIGMGTRRTIRLDENWTAGGETGEDQAFAPAPAEATEKPEEKLIDLAKGHAIPTGGQITDAPRRPERRVVETPAVEEPVAEPVEAPQEMPVSASLPAVEETTPSVAEQTAPAVRSSSIPEPIITEPAAEEPDAALDELTASIGEIREAVERLATEAEPAALEAAPVAEQPEVVEELEPPAVVPAASARTAEALRQVFDRLVDWNIRSADALALIDQAMHHYDDAAEPTADGLFAATVHEMLRPVQTVPGIKVQRGTPRVVALVGTTGSGKTSLAAKLAARYAYERDMNVALISMDTYRIAAVDQLRTFAEIMGFPLEIAYTPEDFARLANSLSADLVIVDTAGRSPLNAKQLEDLQSAFAAHQPDEIHLALPATARYDDVALTLEAFTPVQPTATIITKLDETRTLGMLHNLARLDGPPVSFYSTGQAIPEDLHEAQPGFLTGWAEGLGYGA